VLREGASIVTVSSVNAFLPDPSVIDYSAAKGGAHQLLQIPVEGIRRQGPRQRHQSRTGPD
jgi:hypothetical protein